MPQTKLQLLAFTTHGREAPAGDAPRIDELYQKIAVQHVQMSELHERLAAPEVLTNNLLNKISKLGCKLDNTEATLKQDLETQKTTVSEEIGFLINQNKTNIKDNLLNKISKLGHKLDNTEATFKQKLEAQNTKVSGEFGFLMNQNKDIKKSLEDLKSPSLGTSLNLQS